MSRFLLYALLNTGGVFFGVKFWRLVRRKQDSLGCVEAWMISHRNWWQPLLFLGGDPEITDEEETRSRTENREDHLEICWPSVLPTFKAPIIMHNAEEDAAGICGCTDSGGWLDLVIGYVLRDVRLTRWKDGFCKTTGGAEHTTWTKYS